MAARAGGHGLALGLVRSAKALKDSGAAGLRQRPWWARQYQSPSQPSSVPASPAAWPRVPTRESQGHLNGERL